MTRLLLTAGAAALVLAACSRGEETPPTGTTDRLPANVEPAAAGPVAAPSGQAGRGGRTQDADGDGQVTLEEAKAVQRRILTRADTDKDGTVTAAEAQALPERMAARLTRLDTNGDGSVTGAELDALSEQRFKRRDANKDGVLTGEEMQRRGGRGERETPGTAEDAAG